uniref:AfsR/SARP family transcriptional regulator n=1 Tax=Streptomyces sp. N35 TaxID=2795730 RepID=UPI0018F303DE
MAHVRYSVLGTTQAHRPDGTAVTLGGARRRALPAVPAPTPGRPAPVGRLVDEVGGGEPPADAAGALQALVGRLRRNLGADAVELGPGGYRLTVEHEDVDAYRFERLASEGANALADGDPVKALALFDEGLALWRGPALADLPDRDSEAPRWEARRLEARRGRFTAALALGRAEQLLPELAALAEAHLLDEPLQALRLRALRDAGRAAEALAVYEDVRERLADQLGADPGPELRALHAELLAPRPGGGGPGGPGGRLSEWSGGSATDRPGGSATDWSGGSATHRPGGSATSHPRGPATHWSGGSATDRPGGSATDWPGGSATDRPPAPATQPLTHPAAESPAGSALQPPTPPRKGNLRARLTSFVGREPELEAIRGDLAGARLVTLLGPGGAGKTRLSQEAADGLGFRDGVWLAELA